MVEVTVKLNYKGKNYQTNVIVHKNTLQKQISISQWSKSRSNGQVNYGENLQVFK
ncbi:BA3454 family stress response protein [Neobacillus cucumis]|uniref:BA3454 family stress response protein n=1 Tax=Neobacillus cucumis TaxID=1740721 RepID=UPI0035A84A71